jgi:streptogramin lyase
VTSHLNSLSGAREVEGFLANSGVVARRKLHVQGAGWNVVYTQSLPRRHPRIGIGLVVRVAYTAMSSPFGSSCIRGRRRFALNPCSLDRATSRMGRPGGKMRRTVGLCCAALLLAGLESLGPTAQASPLNEFIHYALPHANSAPNYIAAGPDGALWFTEGAGRIGRITVSGSITEFPIPSAHGDPLSITPGPDGNLWFTEYVAARIGRITPTGAVTEFPIPGGGSPEGITTGPDGNLWFADWFDRIGRLTPAGVFTMFPTSFVVGNFGITAGPDGALWFTEYTGGAIGRITTSGVVTEFPVPDSGSPAGITTGPDGNIWFTEDYESEIGRLSLSGEFKVTHTPQPGRGPIAITPGPRGYLWFTEQRDYRIGRVGMKGKIMESAGRLEAPTGIVEGPDGNLWICNSSANEIAVHVLPHV